MKRAEPSTSSTSEAKRRRVGYDTFTKWQRDYDREWQTLTWLECQSEMEHGKKLVKKLSCRICTKYQDHIKGRKNFSEKWITGAESLRTSNIRDHAQCEQHKHAMTLLKREQARSKGLGAASYAPIAKALPKLPDDERTRLRHKFDIAYFVASEKIAFRKYPRICELELKHGVDLGTTYMNDVACKTFVHYIAEANRQELAGTLDKADFFSLLMDRSTDKGCCDNELVLTVWCDFEGKDERVQTSMSFFKVTRPQAVSGQGLFQVMESALQSLGIHAIDATQCHKLVGIATDGASANIAGGGLKGPVEQTTLDFLDVVSSTPNGIGN